MFFAAVVAIVAVGLGLGLGLLPAGHARAAGPLRTFALSAALTVVLLHLLPEALSELGVWALVVFASTSVLPAWHRLVRGVLGPGQEGPGLAHGGLAAGYVGLLIHHVGDGLGLGAYATLPGGPEEHADVLLALAAHTVPLVAVVAHAFHRTGGTRRAFLAASGLAGASVVGVLASGAVPSELVERYSAWVAALVAGLLVHVVTHDLERDLPTTLGGRAFDALAAVAGVATCLVGGEHASDNHAAAFLAVAAVGLKTLALPVLAGFVLVSLVNRANGGQLRRAVEAALGPGLGLDGLILSVWVGGAAWLIVFAVGAFAVVRAVQTLSPTDPNVDVAPAPVTQAPLPWLVRLDDLTSDGIPWIAAAFSFWVLLAARFPQAELASISAPVAFALALLVAIPVRVPAAAAVIIAAALQHAGLRFEAAVVFAVLATAPGASELAKVGRDAGRRVALRLAVGITLSVIAVGALAVVAESVLRPLDAPPFPKLGSRFALLLLVVLGMRAAFDRSLRGLLSKVFPSHDTASHDESSSERSPASATV